MFEIRLQYKQLVGKWVGEPMPSTSSEIRHKVDQKGDLNEAKTTQKL